MDTPADRAAQYREQALEFRAKAAKVPGGSLFKDQLLNLAARYDTLATKTESSGPAVIRAPSSAPIALPPPPEPDRTPAGRQGLASERRRSPRR